MVTWHLLEKVKKDKKLSYKHWTKLVPKCVIVTNYFQVRNKKKMGLPIMKYILGNNCLSHRILEPFQTIVFFVCLPGFWMRRGHHFLCTFEWQWQQEWGWWRIWLFCFQRRIYWKDDDTQYFHRIPDWC